MGFNAVISACEKAKQPEQALQLFEEMQRRVLEPDVITFSAVISACEKGKQPEQAHELVAPCFEEMRLNSDAMSGISYSFGVDALLISWQSSACHFLSTAALK